MKAYRYEIHFGTLRRRTGLVTAATSEQAFKGALVHEGIDEAEVTKAEFRPACPRCYSFLIEGTCEDCADPFASILRGRLDG